MLCSVHFHYTKASSISLSCFQHLWMLFRFVTQICYSFMQTFIIQMPSPTEISWFEFERTLKVTYFHSPCQWQGHLHYSSCSKPFPICPWLFPRTVYTQLHWAVLFQYLITLIVNNFSLIFNLNLTSFILKLVALVLSKHAPVKDPSPAFLRYWKATCDLPRTLSSPGWITSTLWACLHGTDISVHW